MPTYSTDPDRYLLLPNPNYNESDFAETTRSQVVDEAKGIGGLYSPLKSNGHWKARRLAFDKTKWPNAASAEQWVRENREAFKSFGIAPRRVECLEVAFPKPPTGSEPTEPELELIRPMMLEDLAPSDLYVRTMRLTNDQWGKHNVRLARGFQRNVIGTMPGKSLLLGHPEVKQLAAEPIGHFFDACVERDNSSGVEWGYAKFHLVKTAQNEHARSQIDGGVWNYASIGMELDQLQCSVCGKDYMGGECRHVAGETYPAAQVQDLALETQQDPTDPSKVVAGIIYRGQGQAIEGSIAYLPELNGTQVVADAAFRQSYITGDFGQAKAYVLAQAGDIDGEGPEGEDQPGEQEPENTTPHAEEAKAMSEILEAKAATLEAEKASLEARLGTATAEVAALQTKHAEIETALRTAEPLIAGEKTFRAHAVAELDRLAGLIGRKAELDAFRGMAGDDLAALPAEKVFGVIADWTAQLDTQHPATGRQSTQSETPAPDNEALVVDALAFV